MRIFFIIYFAIGLSWGLAAILSLLAAREWLVGTSLDSSKKQMIGILCIIFLWPMKIISMFTYNREWAKHRFRYWKSKSK
jgi:hypothetical protein